MTQNLGFEIKSIFKLIIAIINTFMVFYMHLHLYSLFAIYTLAYFFFLHQHNSIPVTATLRNKE